MHIYRKECILSPKLKPKDLGLILRAINNSLVTFERYWSILQMELIKYSFINKLAELIKISKLLQSSEILKFASSNNLNS